MKALAGSDHYILVMAKAALPKSHKMHPLADAVLRSPRKTINLIYVLIGVGVVVAIIAYVLLRSRS